MMVADPASPSGERAKLLDFGIAKFVQGVADLPKSGTNSHMILGTPQYMSPEQCRSQKDIDGKADVYALGVLLYRLLAGRLPFVSSDPMELMQKHVFDAPPPLETAAPTASKALVKLIHQMLDQDRAVRPGMHDVFGKLQGMRKRALASIAISPAALQLMAALAPVQGNQQNGPADLMQKAPPSAPAVMRPARLMERLTVPLAWIRAGGDGSSSPPPGSSTAENAMPILTTAGTTAPEVSTLTLRKRRATLVAMGGLLVASLVAGGSGMSLGHRIGHVPSWIAAHFATPQAVPTAPRAATPRVAPAAPSALSVSAPANPIDSKSPRSVTTGGPSNQNMVAPDAAGLAHAPEPMDSPLSKIPKPRMDWDETACEQWKQLGFQQKRALQSKESFDSFKAAYEGCGQPSLLNEMGRAQENMGRFELALTFYQHVLTQDLQQTAEDKRIARTRKDATCTQCAEHYVGLPMDADRASHPLHSLAVLEYVRALCPDERFLLGRAHLLHMQGRGAEAVAACDQYLATQPNPALEGKARALRVAAQGQIAVRSTGALLLR